MTREQELAADRQRVKDLTAKHKAEEKVQKARDQAQSLINSAEHEEYLAELEKATSRGQMHADRAAKARADAKKILDGLPKDATAGQAPDQRVDAPRHVTPPAPAPPVPSTGLPTKPAPTAPVSVPAAPAGATTGGTTGGPAPTTGPLSDDQIHQKVQQDFPAFSYLLDDPEVGKILLDSVREGYTKEQFAGRLYGTSWWKTHSDSARTWDSQIHTDPEAAKQKLLATAAGLDAEAAKFGVKLDPTQRWVLADNSIRFNWTQQQMNLALGAAARKQGVSGALATTADSLVATAHQYGVTVPQDAANDWATKITEGSATQDAYTHYVTGLAKARWANDPSVGNALDQGITPTAYFAPHQQALATVLGVAPSQIDLFNDPKYSSVTDYFDPQTKTKRSRTIGETQQLGRDLVAAMPFEARPDWWKQQDAQFATNLLSLFGKAA